MAATETLRIIVESKKKGTGAEESKKGLEGLKKAAALAAAAFGAMKAAQGAIDFLKLGAQVEAVGARFRAFSGSAEAAEGYLTAMGRASDYTLDKMSAMAGASKLLGMNLVANADEMETMAAIAVKLGDQTISAGDRIADFAALLANRSVPRLDNFNMASGRVRANIEELTAAGYDLDEAFKLAVLAEGDKALARLGDTSELTATKVARVEAQLTDLKNTSAGTFASIVADSGALDWLNERLAILPSTLNALGTVMGAYGATVRSVWGEHTTLGEALDVFNGQLQANVINQNNLYAATEQTRYAYTALGEGTAALVAEQQREVEIQQALAAASVGAVNTFAAYNAALASEVAAQEAATHATNMHREAMAQIAAQAVETQGYILDVGMSWQSHFDSVAEQAATFASTMTATEQEHQANVAQIVQSGQDERTAIDIAAEEQKLTTLQESLTQALAELTLYNANATAEDTAAKQAEVDRLTAQVATQEQMVGDFYAGRLGNLTENAAAMLTEENARYAEEQRIQAEAQALLEEEQRASLGRMVLQAFDAWASMKGIAAGDALEMRTAIAKEYGLIDAETARTVSSMVSLWESWADGTGRSAGETIASMQRVIGKADATRSAIERIPAMRRTRHEHTEVKIKITRRKEEGSAGGGIPEGAQQGTMYSPGGMTLVGERGAEMMYVPRGAKIYDAMKTRGMQMGGGGIGINATFNIYPAAGMDEEGLARKVMRVMDVKLLRNRVAQQARLRGQGRGLLG